MNIQIKPIKVVFVNNWTVKTGTNSHHMEHEHCICVMCSADEWCGDQGYDMFMLRRMEAGRGLSSSKGCQYVFQMLEVGGNIPNTRMLYGLWLMATWHTYLGYPHTPQHLPNFNKVSVSHHRFYPAWQTLFVPPCQLCCCWCGGVATSHMSPPDPDLASSGPGRAEAGVATLKDPGTKVKDFHWEQNCKSFMQG